jgi:signal transduction histidine kinase
MGVVRASGEFLSTSMPVILVSAGIVMVLLAAVVFYYRFEVISRFIRRYLLFRPQYDYHRIFMDSLERFDMIKNYQDLYPAILTATCRIVSAHGASLLIRDGDSHFQMAASQGLLPFSFHIDEVKGFLEWIEKKRVVVTRSQLVGQRSYASIKSEGLRYCIQFNAEACVPLFLGETLYGILHVGSRKSGSYDRGTCDFLRFLAAYFTTAIRTVDLNQTLMRERCKLEQAVEFRNRLLSNLSHELRTPLNSIIGLSEILEEGVDGPLTGEQLEHVSMIHRSGKRLLATVNSIVDLSKIEANHLELHVQKVNLRRLVGDLAESIPFNDHTKLSLNLGDEIPSVYGDEPWLKQVFWHLLDNAAKFTKHGKVSVGAQKCGEMLKVCIADTGVGIPEEKRDVIFQGFCQGDGSATREHEGLGLGLAISKKIVELHGGRIWFNSKVGHGSHFYLTLPLKPTGVAHTEISLS